MVRDKAYLYEPADIDSTSVEMLPDNRELFAFQVTLSGSPDNLWKQTFELVWRESRYLGKLDAVVLKDSIRFICRQSQGMEDYLYLIESRIEATNLRMQAYWECQGVQVERLKYQHYPSTFIPLGKMM
jgi:hypothetical protein